MRPRIALLVDFLGPLEDAGKRLEQLDMQGLIELKPLHSVGARLLPEYLADCDGCITRPSGPPLAAEHIPKDRSPFVVATMSVGKSHLAAIERLENVRIVTSPGMNAGGTAELTVLLAQLLGRPVHKGLSVMEAGTFDRSDFASARRLKGLRWLALGGGNVVRALVRRLACHDLAELMIWNRTADRAKLEFLTQDVPAACVSELQEVEGGVRTTIQCSRSVVMDVSVRQRVLGRELAPAELKQMDIVSLHVELTQETHDVVNAGFLSNLKPGALLVNMGRGELVDEDEIVTALQSGQLGGFAADVVAEAAENDRDPSRSKLWAFAIENRTSKGARKANVLLTPHVGGHVLPDLANTANRAVDQILEVLGIEPIDSVVRA